MIKLLLESHPYDEAFEKELALLDVHSVERDDNFFAVVSYVENTEDLERLSEYKRKGVGTLAIVGNIPEGIENYYFIVDRFVVHTNYHREILSRELDDRTKVVKLNYPAKYRTNLSDGRGIFVSPSSDDENVLSLVEYVQRTENPEDAEVIVIASLDETLAFRKELFEYVGYAKPLVLSRIPTFEEFAYMELTPEILYTQGNAESFQKALKHAYQKHEYFSNLLKAYAMYNSYRRFARRFTNVIRNIIPEDYLSLYVL